VSTRLQSEVSVLQMSLSNIKVNLLNLIKLLICKQTHRIRAKTLNNMIRMVVRRNLFSSEWGCMDKNLPGTVRAAQKQSNKPTNSSITTYIINLKFKNTKHKNNKYNKTEKLMNEVGYIKRRCWKLFFSNLQQALICNKINKIKTNSESVERWNKLA